MYMHCTATTHELLVHSAHTAAAREHGRCQPYTIPAPFPLYRSAAMQPPPVGLIHRLQAFVSRFVRPCLRPTCCCALPSSSQLQQLLQSLQRPHSRRQSSRGESPCGGRPAAAFASVCRCRLRASRRPCNLHSRSVQVHCRHRPTAGCTGWAAARRFGRRSPAAVPGCLPGHGRHWPAVPEAGAAARRRL